MKLTALLFSLSKIAFAAIAEHHPRVPTIEEEIRTRTLNINLMRDELNQLEAEIQRQQNPVELVRLTELRRNQASLLDDLQRQLDDLVLEDLGLPPANNPVLVRT